MIGSVKEAASSRAIAIAVALGWTAIGFGALTAVPSDAVAGEVHYRATLAVPVAAPTQDVVSGVVWACKGETCIGTKGRSRPVIECTRLAREHGAVRAFSIKGEALAADDLARCNS